MTNFEHTPYNTVKIKQLIKLDFAEFQKRRILEGSTAKWVDGVLFAPFPAPDSIDTVREELAGIMHWFYCEVVSKPEKISKLKHDGVELDVLDVSTNPLFTDFAKWVKGQEIWSKK